MSTLFSPPVAFALYIVLVAALMAFAWSLAPRGHASAEKTSIYASGELAQAGTAAPGYKPFFLVAFFFAILHLGVLIVGSGWFNVVTGVYILGLIFSLVALALG